MAIKNPSKLRKYSSAIIGGFIIVSSVIMTLSIFSKTISSLNDVKKISGKLVWVKMTKPKDVRYEIKLNNYQTTFIVRPDYKNIFRFNQLKRDNTGNITLELSVKNDINIQSEALVTVYSVSSRSKKYLDINEVLRIDKNNRITTPLFSLFIIILGIGVYIYRRYYYSQDV